MAPYSYRDDASVPQFDDAQPIAFMDGDCALCSFGARMISRFDRSGDIRICPVQTPLGRAILAHFDMQPDDPETWLFLENGVAHRDFDAMIHVGIRTGWPLRIMSVLKILPKPARDWLYSRVARNRYAMFGRRDMCAIPDPALRARLMS